MAQRAQNPRYPAAYGTTIPSIMYPPMEFREIIARTYKKRVQYSLSVFSKISSSWTISFTFLFKGISVVLHCTHFADGDQMIKSHKMSYILYSLVRLDHVTGIVSIDLTDTYLLRFLTAA